MFNKSTVLLVSLSALFATGCKCLPVFMHDLRLMCFIDADVTSLSIPGFPTGVAWAAVKVGSDGDTTTWRVGPGKESGGLTPLLNQASCASPVTVSALS